MRPEPATSLALVWLSFQIAKRANCILSEPGSHKPLIQRLIRTAKHLDWQPDQISRQRWFATSKSSRSDNLPTPYLVFEGSLLLLYVSGMFCVLSGIGIGAIIATFTRSQQQAQLLGFFVTPPLSMLSGATSPIEAIPHWMQPLTYLNPVRHFATLARGVMLKGVGIEVSYPNLLALLAFTLVLMGISVWRFRKQLN